MFGKTALQAQSAFDSLTWVDPVTARQPGAHLHLAVLEAEALLGGEARRHDGRQDVGEHGFPAAALRVERASGAAVQIAHF